MPVKKGLNLIKAASFRVKYKDIFNLGDFYEQFHFYLLEEGWSSVDPDGNLEGDEFFEIFYKELVSQGGAKEHSFWWRLQRIPNDNSYYKYHLDINFHTLAIMPTEVMRDGKKFKAHKGEVEMFVDTYIEFDVGGQWSSHPFLKMFANIFPNRIFKKDLYEKHKLELYRETYVMQAWVKKWFQLRRFLPYEEVTSFHPSGAYPKWKK